MLLAARDNTALAFRDAWRGAAFAAVRDVVPIVTRDTESHSFAREGDADWLFEQVMAAVRSSSGAGAGPPRGMAG